MDAETDLVVRTLGVPVRIRGDIPQAVASTLVDLLDDRQGGDLPTLAVRAQASGWTVEGSPDTSVTPATTPMALADDLVAGLNRLGLNGDEGRLHVHAAVVQRGADGIVLCGPSNSGKSTFAAALVELGCAYLTDETATIVPGSSTVLAYPKPLALRDWAITRFAGVAPVAANARHVVAASTLGALASSTRPSILVFPRYRRDGGLDLRPVPPEEAVHRLVEDLLDGERFGPGALDELVLLVNRCTTWSVEYSDIGLAASAVLELPAAHTTVPSRRWDEGRRRAASVGDRVLRLDMDAKHLTSTAAPTAQDEGGTESARRPPSLSPEVIAVLATLREAEIPAALAGIGAIALDHPEGAELGPVEPEIAVPPHCIERAHVVLADGPASTSVVLDGWPPRGHFETTPSALAGATESVSVLDPVDRFIHLVHRISTARTMRPAAIRAVTLAAPRARPLLADLADRIEDLGMTATWPDGLRQLARQVPGLPEGLLSLVAPELRPIVDHSIEAPPALDTDGWEHVARFPTARSDQYEHALRTLAGDLGTDQRFAGLLARAIRDLGPLQTTWWLGVDGRSWRLRFPPTDAALDLITATVPDELIPALNVWWYGVSSRSDGSIVAELARSFSPDSATAQAVVRLNPHPKLDEVRLALAGPSIKAQVADLSRRSVVPIPSSASMDRLLAAAQRVTFLKRPATDALVVHGVLVEHLDQLSMPSAALAATQRAFDPQLGVAGGLLDIELLSEGRTPIVAAIGGRA